MTGKKAKNKAMVAATLLFIIYVIFLVWMLLFKMRVSLEEIYKTRSINLIPFYNATLHSSDIVNNVIVFIPFGVYLTMLFSNLNVVKKAIIVLGTSLAIESFQYILAIGCADITDVITNTFGGLLGICLYLLIKKIFKNKQRVDFIITIMAGFGTVLIIALLSVVFTVNR